MVGKLYVVYVRGGRMVSCILYLKTYARPFPIHRKSPPRRDALMKLCEGRTLRQYGYPPDMQKLATDTVLKQAELIAEDLVG